jgi:hypothetical protein
MTKAITLETLLTDESSVNEILEKHRKHQKITDTEIKATAVRLENIVTWAKTVSKTLDIPLRL